MNEIQRKRMVQQYYARRSEDYDRQKSRTWTSSKGFSDEIFMQLFNAFAQFKGKTVLEVGVGSGRNALPLIEKTRLRLVGLDLAKQMLCKAKSKIKSNKLEADFVQGDMEHLSFRAELFDGILCMSTMHYLFAKERIIRSFAQLLKTSGLFVFGDLTVHENDSRGFFERLENAVSKVHGTYCKPSEAATLLEKAGLTIHSSKTVAYRKTYAALIEDKGAYFNVEALDLQHLVETADEVSMQLYDLTPDDLMLYYTIIVAEKENER